VDTLYTRWIQRSIRIKKLQEFLKSDHWLRRYCILSGGLFYFEPPCSIVKTFYSSAKGQMVGTVASVNRWKINVTFNTVNYNISFLHCDQFIYHVQSGQRSKPLYLQTGISVFFLLDWGMLENKALSINWMDFLWSRCHSCHPTNIVKAL